MLMRLFSLCRVAPLVEPHKNARLRVEGTIWVLLSLALALFVPEILYVINPLGGLAGAFILIFPGNTQSRGVVLASNPAAPASFFSLAGRKTAFFTVSEKKLGRLVSRLVLYILFYESSSPEEDGQG